MVFIVLLNFTPFICFLLSVNKKAVSDCSDTAFRFKILSEVYFILLNSILLFFSLPSSVSFEAIG